MKRFCGSGERGFTFIEVLAVLVILGTIAVGFLAALTAANNSTTISDERTTAESLARTEMEYVKDSIYVMASWNYDLPAVHPSWDVTHALPTGYTGYTVAVEAAPLRLVDDGIQSITVTVSFNSKALYTLEGYKVSS